VEALTWTWDYFFVPQNQTTPDGTGFGTFSPIHFGVLGLLAVGIAALVVAYRRSDADQRRRTRLVVAWIVLLLEVFRQLAYLLAGVYSPDLLPLHLCAAATFAVFVDAIRPNRIWGTNFWFLDAGSPGSPLEPIQAFAGGFYIPVLIVAVAIMWTLLYLPWALRDRSGRAVRADVASPPPTP
jgi:uncharacterized membrane protein YwaF